MISNKMFINVFNLRIKIQCSIYVLIVFWVIINAKLVKVYSIAKFY